MPVDLLLRNGLVIIEGRAVNRSVAIDEGKIEGIYEPNDAPTASEIIDCTDKYVLPGMIDIHVHLRDLEQSYKEDYATGTMAAAAGGVTTVVDMPNSIPPTIDMDALQAKIDNAHAKRFVNVGFYAGLPKKIETFDERVISSILGIKVYPHNPLTKVTYGKLRILESVKLAAKHNIPLLLHPDSCKRDARPTEMEEFFKLHSCESETDSVEKFLSAEKEVDGRLHVCHVSCAATARLIIENREERHLTAEVSPHHLLLDSDSHANGDGTAKMLPPLRSPYDNEFLWTAVTRCAIDIVASDHAPHTEQEKKKPYLEAASGIPGLETTVPLMLTEVMRGRMTWVEFLRCCCSGPASVLGLSTKGVLAKGYDADLVVVSRVESTIKGANFYSKAKITPFEGHRIVACPTTTIVGGDIVYDNGKIVLGAGVAGRVPVRRL